MDSSIEVLASNREPVSGSAAWCVTMQICWDSLLGQLCGGGPLVPKGEERSLVLALNDGRLGRDTIPNDHYYAYAGPRNSAARREIEDAIRLKFGQTSDVLGAIDWSAAPEGLVDFLFYCMLYREFSFPVPFGVAEDVNWGGESFVTCFEAADPDPHLEERMRRQVHPLYYLDEEHHAVSIATKEGDRVILVRSPEGASFSDMWEAIQRRAGKANRRQKKPLGENDTFCCPNLSLDLYKEFKELEGVEFDAADGSPCKIGQALQTIRMRLDNEGGEVKSEAALLALAGCLPMELPDVREFIYDGPFTLFLLDGRLRHGSKPYLALMVDDIELFQ